MNDLAIDDQERLRRFGEAIDEIRRRTEAKIGEEDVAYVKRVDRFSRVMELIGRVLIHISFEPITFGVGVIALWIYKQLQATEVGHTTLHGAFDKLEGAENYNSKTFYWEPPIDEASWRYVHNVRHHQYTNIAGRDPDIHFGDVRLNEHTPHHPVHLGQFAYAMVLAANFSFLINVQYTGLGDIYIGNRRPEEFDFIEERTPEAKREAWKKALRKYVPYLLTEYVLFPLMAGPFFWKVMLGNWLAGTMRDFYSAATIFCGHVGEDVHDYPEGTRAGGRARWYAMQVESANNFEVPRPVSVLCGALDRQIEHHLFPRFPTTRLREVSPEVRRICEKYGVEYRTDTWGRTLKRVLLRIWRLSQPIQPARLEATA